MTTTHSNRRSSFGIKCIQCGSEQIAPERSEYWSDRHAFHIWHCPKCTTTFASRVSRLVSY
jgi:ribosomal protein L37AE/L43A